MRVLRLAMWSGPRNVSTAFMRSWGNRSDTLVVDEPFYAHYLQVTGLDHPGRDEIIARIMTALAPVVGRAPQAESAQEAGCRTRSALVALAGTLESLASADAPVTVVYFESHLIAPRSMAVMSSTIVNGR